MKRAIVKTEYGFTLIELMMAMTLFGVVAVVCTAALLSIVDASRKAQAIQSVMSNLNTALDGMVRSVRMGSNYAVSNGGNRLEFSPYGADPADVNKRWVYEWIDISGDGTPDALVKEYLPSGYITRVQVPVTAPEVLIEYLRFYVDGERDDDDKQPRVLLVIRGKAGIEKIKTTTSFSIQASATQRLLDI
jgi:prepilin-type N-terminal cleavage/methylation domain-containing protein